MAVRRLLSFLGIFAAALFGGCMRSSATKADIVGSWKARDGAVIILEDNGQFSAQELPGSLVFRDDDRRDRLSGNGTWSLKEGVIGPDIELVFGRIGDRLHGHRMRVLMSGSGSSVQLFLWIREEGGARYVFAK